MMSKQTTEAKVNNDMNTRPANQCRACDNVRGNKLASDHPSIYTCAKCGAIFGECYLGDSYAFVKPYMTAEEVPAEEQRYFDFTTVSSMGIGRRHGWYQPSTKLITQVG